MIVELLSEGIHPLNSFRVRPISLDRACALHLSEVPEVGKTSGPHSTKWAQVSDPAGCRQPDALRSVSDELASARTVAFMSRKSAADITSRMVDDLYGYGTASVQFESGLRIAPDALMVHRRCYPLSGL